MGGLCIRETRAFFVSFFPKKRKWGFPSFLKIIINLLVVTNRKPYKVEYYSNIMGLVKKLGKAIVPFALAGSMFLGGCDSQPPQPQRLEQRISQEVAQPNGQPDKYGVILNGANDEDTMPDIILAYQIMLENNFSPENIYILSNNSAKYERHIYPKTDIFSKQSLEMLIDHLGKKVDSKDFLVMYLINHGEQTTKDGEETVKTDIPGGDIFAEDIRGYLESIHPQTGLAVFNTCYAGGFSRLAGNGDYIAISSSDYDHTSKKGFGKNFGGLFFLAYREKGESDSNKDGKISVQEAFEYAKTQMKRPKDNPQLVSERNPDEIFLK